MSLAIIFIFAFALTVRNANAADYSSALVDVWNNRKDLQKAFPGDPSNNSKLEAWCKKYGWKEEASLSSCSTNKTVSAVTISPDYEGRIATLEAKITELTNQISQLSSSSATGNISVSTNQEGEWRKCVLHGLYNSNIVDNDNNGDGYTDGNYNLVCPISINDKNVKMENSNSGYSMVYVRFK